MAGLGGSLAGLVQRAEELAGAGEPAGVHRVLPVLGPLRPLLPGQGLRRGAIIAVKRSVADGSAGVRPGSRPATGLALIAAGGSVAATSLMLALLAEASRTGSCCAVVGVPTLGVAAAAELGVALDRLALVPDPGPEWVNVVAALIDGVDVVVAAPPGPVTAHVASRLAARVRQRGCVLVPFGRWEGADVTLESVRGVWEGLGQGHGRLHRRQVTISARGRGAAIRPKQVQVWLPASSGGIASVESPTPPVLTVITGDAGAEPTTRLAGNAAELDVRPASSVAERDVGHRRAA